MTSSPRIQAVDDFRGFAIASMIVVNFMAFLVWDAKLIQVLVGTAGIYGLCYLLAFYLNKRELYWKL
jgi:hypothetical protein